MKTYNYRLVVKKGLNPGRIVTRSNNIDRILTAWERDNYDRHGNRYPDHQSEIETLRADGTWHGVYEGF